jgi:beta-lactamase superfamily II metal-dependent hydrolase
MADRIRIRAYNVRFGDAILVTVPDRDGSSGPVTKRHMLVDFGNVLAGAGGEDAVFKPVIDNIIGQLDGRPLDLYVMTHEHLDHVQGLFHVASKIYPDGELATKFTVDTAWLTASAEPGYYDTHPDARKKLDVGRAAYDQIRTYLAALPAEAQRPFEALLANNNPRSTAQCVEFLRTVAPAARTHYVSRGFATAGTHPFREAALAIWAPEEDTSEYYSPLLPMALSGAAPVAGAAVAAAPRPPAGVDAGAFYDLVVSRASGLADNILAIDKAANNSSIVFTLTWRGRKILFPGDAELKSWRMMRDRGVLEPVDALKVSHHGSHNGTPDPDILDLFLPTGHASGRRAIISTWDDTYSGIPHDPTNDKLRARARLTSTLDSPDKLFKDAFINPAQN